MADRNITKRLHRVARAATFALAVISLSAAAVRPAHAAEDGKTRVNVGVTELTDKNIRMTVGGIELPSLTKASQTKHYKATDLGGNNTFYKNGKYVPMKPYKAANAKDSTIVIPVTAEVSTSYKVTQNTKPVAQFRLLYTVSPLDKAGNVLRCRTLQGSRCAGAPAGCGRKRTKTKEKGNDTHGRDRGTERDDREQAVRAQGITVHRIQHTKQDMKAARRNSCGRASGRSMTS